MVDKQEIQRLLNEYFKITGKIIIHDSGVVDVFGSVELMLGTKKLPVQFGEIKNGNFYCSYNNELSSLEGSPKSVIGGNFDCSYTQISSLEGAPLIVSGDFSCDGNYLTSLEGAPSSVGQDFICRGNKLTSLEGAPKTIVGSFNCFNNKLTSLKGAPTMVGGDFYCGHNQLTSLEGAPKTVVGFFDFGDNPQLTSFHGAPKIVGGDFYSLNNNKVVSLEGSPNTVGGSFYCDSKHLVSLKGAPSSIGGEFKLYYRSDLPLLRTIVANGGVNFYNPSRYPVSREIQKTLNQFKGKGKRGFLAATIALLKLEKELQKETPWTNIRENIKW